MKVINSILSFAVLSLFFICCSNYNKLLKSTDFNKKYEAAVKYYDAGDYSKALALLEELVSVYRGTERAEKIFYYYAYATYASGDYLLAGYHFNNFAKTFPLSEHAEECAYMNGYCYFLESPKYSLDQTETKNAIRELQNFIYKYPNSQRIKQCNDLIDQLRAKLEKKYYEIAKQYYFLNDYKAAAVSFENVLKDYPDTKFREEIMFLVIKANYLYSLKSIEAKKAERLKTTMDSYNKFISYFPESARYGKEASGIFASAKKQYENSNK